LGGFLIESIKNAVRHIYQTVQQLYTNSPPRGSWIAWRRRHFCWDSRAPRLGR
jgi:hypothetical protein